VATDFVSTNRHPTGDAGRICLVETPWQEKEGTYANRPPLGRELARLGPMVEHQAVQRVLDFVPPRSGTLRRPKKLPRFFPRTF